MQRIITTIIILLLFATTIATAQTAYFPFNKGLVKDFLDHDVKTLDDEAAKILKIEGAEDLKDNFGVFDVAHYRIKSYTPNGYTEDIAEYLKHCSSQKKYYLLFIRTFDNNYKLQATKVELLLPTEGKFSCLTAMQRSLIKIRIEKKLQEKLPIDPNGYISQLAGIEQLKTEVTKTVDCCYNGGNKGREGCSKCLSFYEIRELLEDKGYVLAPFKVKIIGKLPLTKNENENFGNKNAKITINDYAKLQLKIDEEEVNLKTFIGNGLGEIPIENFEANVSIYGNEDFCETPPALAFDSNYKGTTQMQFVILKHENPNKYDEIWFNEEININFEFGGNSRVIKSYLSKSDIFYAPLNFYHCDYSEIKSEVEKIYADNNLDILDIEIIPHGNDDVNLPPYHLWEKLIYSDASYNGILSNIGYSRLNSIEYKLSGGLARTVNLEIEFNNLKKYETFVNYSYFTKEKSKYYDKKKEFDFLISWTLAHEYLHQLLIKFEVFITGDNKQYSVKNSEIPLNVHLDDSLNLLNDANLINPMEYKDAITRKKIDDRHKTLIIYSMLVFFDGNSKHYNLTKELTWRKLYSKKILIAEPPEWGSNKSYMKFKK